MNKIRKRTVVLALLMPVAIFFTLNRIAYRGVESEIAVVTLASGNDAKDRSVAVVYIYDMHGMPAEGVGVSIEGDSGYGLPVKTNKDGVVLVTTGEHKGQFMRVYLEWEEEMVEVWISPYEHNLWTTILGEFFRPNSDATIEIHLKVEQGTISE